MAQYMGPSTNVTYILQKLAVTFGTVVSFDVLMKNFYKVTQGNHEKIPSFAMRLGTLNQIRLQCPRKMTDLEVHQHFKDHLFHGVHKYIRDSIRYLYSTPGTSYSQLIVAVQKAENENEEVLDKVRARAAVANNYGKGTTEIGHEIAKLMAVLTKAGQGSNPANVPSSSRDRGHVRGHEDRGTHGCSSSNNSQAGLGRLPWTAAHLLAMGQGLP